MPWERFWRLLGDVTEETSELARFCGLQYRGQEFHALPTFHSNAQNEMRVLAFLFCFSRERGHPPLIIDYSIELWLCSGRLSYGSPDFLF